MKIKIEDLQTGDVLPSGRTVKTKTPDAIWTQEADNDAILLRDIEALFGPEVDITRPEPKLEPFDYEVTGYRISCPEEFKDGTRVRVTPLPEDGTEPKVEVPADVMKAAKNVLSPYSGCFSESRACAGFILKLAGEK